MVVWLFCFTTYQPSFRSFNVKSSHFNKQTTQVAYSTCSCLSGHPIKYGTGSLLLNFGDLAGTSVFSMT